MKIQPTMSVFSYSIRRNELQTNKNYAMRRNLTSSYVEALSFKGNPFANTAVKGFRNIQGLLCDESGKVYTGVIKKFASIAKYDKGKLVGQEFDSIGGGKSVYKYNNMGGVESVENFDSRGCFVSGRYNSFDDSGKMISSSVVDDV